MNITKNEQAALIGVVNNQYHIAPFSAENKAHIVDHFQWTEAANVFSNPRTFSGVVASLVKKGLAKVTASGTDEAAIAITEAGWDALAELNLVPGVAESQSICDTESSETNNNANLAEGNEMSKHEHNHGDEAPKELTAAEKAKQLADAAKAAREAAKAEAATKAAEAKALREQAKAAAATAKAEAEKLKAEQTEADKLAKAEAKKAKDEAKAAADAAKAEAKRLETEEKQRQSADVAARKDAEYNAKREERIAAAKAAVEAAQARYESLLNGEGEMKNGQRKPGADTKCGRAWALLAKLNEEAGVVCVPVETFMTACAEAGEEAVGTQGNVKSEFYNFRRFHGIVGRV